MITTHAGERIKERYKDNSNFNMMGDLREAKRIKNYKVLQDPLNKRRILIYFSKDKHFLWKTIMSTKDGAIITVLPVQPYDIQYCVKEGIIDNNLRFHKVEDMG